jgi:ethanolamine-phosphate cytidylyltransferase
LIFLRQDAEGNDSYAVFKRIGKHKEVKRTEGISTTSLIERVLRPDVWAPAGADNQRLEHLLDLFVKSIQSPFPVIRYEHLTSEHGCEVLRQAWPGQRKVVYLGSSWDCFGAGHVELLRRAKRAAAADDPFLVVGVWSDEV